ncbi:MAG: diacylglycerol kinase family protein [Cyclobacteriaceae bacterium]
MKKIFVLTNPTSGKRTALKALAILEKVLTTDQVPYESHLTQTDRNGWETVGQELDETFTDLIILGGDGTINEAVNGLNYKIPVGIIPCGTGNDYAKCFNLGKSLQEQIQTAISGRIKPVDIGVCNDRKFLNGVGVGFDGQIVADMISQKTWLQGAAKYYYHVLKILSSYKAKTFDYKLNKERHKKDLILLCVAKGTTFGGSFKLTPNAVLDDGKLHVCEIGDLKPLRRFLNISRLEGGSHTVLKEVQMYQAEELMINEQPQLHAHIDGEYFGNPPFRFSVLTGGLRVRVR